MHEGTLYNRIEAGNLLWGAASARAGVTEGATWFAAHGYTMLKEGKADEMGEWNAINQGRNYFSSGSGFKKNGNFWGTQTQGEDQTRGVKNPLKDYIDEHSPFSK
jgi:hypothetical protein